MKSEKSRRLTERLVALSMLILPGFLFAQAVIDVLRFSELFPVFASGALLALHAFVAVGLLRRFGWAIPSAFSLQGLSWLIITWALAQMTLEWMQRYGSSPPSTMVLPSVFVSVSLLLVMVVLIWYSLRWTPEVFMRSAILLGVAIVGASALLALCLATAGRLPSGLHAAVVWVTHLPSFILITAHQLPFFGGERGVFHDLLLVFSANAAGLVMIGSVIVVRANPSASQRDTQELSSARTDCGSTGHRGQ